MISRPEIFLLPNLRVLEDKELRHLLVTAVARYGSRRSAIRTLGWNQSQSQQLLDAPPIADIPGAGVLSLSLEDIAGTSLLTVRKRIRAMIIRFVMGLAEAQDGDLEDDPTLSGYDVARFLGIKEWDVRRNSLR